MVEMKVLKMHDRNKRHGTNRGKVVRRNKEYNQIEAKLQEGLVSREVESYQAQIFIETANEVCTRRGIELVMNS